MSSDFSGLSGLPSIRVGLEAFRVPLSGAGRFSLGSPRKKAGYAIQVPNSYAKNPEHLRFSSQAILCKEPGQWILHGHAFLLRQGEDLADVLTRRQGRKKEFCRHK